MSEMYNVLVGIDAGSKQSGVLVMEMAECGYTIKEALNLDNEAVIDKIQAFVGVHVVVEDIAPYTGQLSPYLIQTIKYLGELEYRLKAAGISYNLLPRSAVKEWCYNQYKEIVEPLIGLKMTKRANKDGGSALYKKNGELKRPSFVWMDDKIIVACMREEWSVPAISSRRQKYGLKDHSWQALALLTTYINR